MSGTLTPVLFVALVLVLVLLLVLLAWTVGRRRPPRVRPVGLGSSLTAVDAARLEGGERKASLVGEQIEEMVRERLARFPDLVGLRVDFGTGPRGELEIWAGEDRYGSVEEIPEARIRQAVAEAVEAFNR